MVATAVFWTRSWDPAVASNPVENVLHSATAALLGFCFAFGVLTFLVLGPLVVVALSYRLAVRRFDRYSPPM